MKAVNKVEWFRMTMGRLGSGFGPSPYGLKANFWGYGPTQINILYMALIAQ